MKKLAIVAAALVLAAAPAFSQVIPGAGYLNSTLVSGGNSSAQNGFYAGVSMDMDLFGVKGLTLAPGVYASAIFWISCLSVPVTITVSIRSSPSISPASDMYFALTHASRSSGKTRYQPG